MLHFLLKSLASWEKEEEGGRRRKRRKGGSRGQEKRKGVSDSENAFLETVELLF